MERLDNLSGLCGIIKVGGKMVKCDKCAGKGYVVQAARLGLLLVGIRVWCAKCKGKGEHPYEGDRSGIEWERE